MTFRLDHSSEFSNSRKNQFWGLWCVIQGEVQRRNRVRDESRISRHRWRISHKGGNQGDGSDAIREDIPKAEGWVSVRQFEFRGNDPSSARSGWNQTILERRLDERNLGQDINPGSLCCQGSPRLRVGSPGYKTGELLPRQGKRLPGSLPSSTLEWFVETIVRQIESEERTPREDLVPRCPHHCRTEETEYVPECRRVPRKQFRPWTSPDRIFFRRTRPFVDPRGTPGMMSVNACNGKEQGRCDDLWWFIYSLVLIVGDLPWLYEEHPVPPGNFTLSDQFYNHTGIEFKKPHLEKLDEIEKMLKACDFYSFPDYHMIYEFLHGVMEESGATWNDPYDWEQKDEMWSRAVEGWPKTVFSKKKVDHLCSILRRDD